MYIRCTHDVLRMQCNAMNHSRRMVYSTSVPSFLLYWSHTHFFKSNIVDTYPFFISHTNTHFCCCG